MTSQTVLLRVSKVPISKSTSVQAAVTPLPRLLPGLAWEAKLRMSKGQTPHMHAATALVSREIIHVQAAIDAAGAVVRDGVYDAETCRGVLHSAAGGGHVAALELLLAAGAPVDAKDGNGLTALQVDHAQLGPTP